MLRELEVAYADTAASQLSLSFDDAPDYPRLDTLLLESVAGPGTRLELHLLGASHEIVFEYPGGRCREVVACLPIADPRLPERLSRSRDGLDYRFEARIRTLSRERFTAEVSDLRDRLADHPYALVGVYPGDAHAVTALLATPGAGRVEWHSWHAYPQTGEIATTHTVAVLEDL